MFTIVIFIPALYLLFRPTASYCYFLSCRNRLEPTDEIGSAYVSFQITRLAKKYNPYLPTIRLGFLRLSSYRLYTLAGIAATAAATVASVIFLPDSIPVAFSLAIGLLTLRLIVDAIIKIIPLADIRDNRLMIFCAVILPIAVYALFFLIVKIYLNTKI